MIRVSFITNFPSHSLTPLHPHTPPSFIPRVLVISTGKGRISGFKASPSCPNFIFFCVPAVPEQFASQVQDGAGGRQERGRCAGAGPGGSLGGGLGAGVPGAGGGSASPGRRDNTDPSSKVLRTDSTSSHIRRQRKKEEKKKKASTPLMSSSKL